MAAAKLSDYAKQTCDATKKGTVLPAEVCTMDTALKLGIANKDNYFKTGSDYESLKSLNKTFDNADSKRFNKLCYESVSVDIDKPEAYTNCVIEHGMPFTRKKGDMTKCVPAECPPDFEKTMEGCKKPVIGDSTLLKSHCDERWYDWFTVPYYHLGNKYQEDAEGKCFVPCKTGYIPGYAKDPVDGANMDLSSTDELDKCINKYNYFGGKYKESNDFCPIAIVKRIGTTKDDLKTEFIDRVNKVSNKNTHATDIIQKIVPGEVEDVYKQLTASTTIEFPKGDLLKACRKLHTEERLADTYTICRKLSQNADSVTEQFVRDGSGVEEAKMKTNMLKKSCHTLFCNKDDDASTVIAEKVWPEGSCGVDDKDEDCVNRISGEPICFADVENMNFEEDAKKLKKMNAVRYPEVSADESKMKLNTSFKWMIYCIVIPVGAVIAWGVWTQLLWPYIIRPLWRLLVKLLTGYRRSAQEDIAEEILADIRNTRVPKAAAKRAAAAAPAAAPAVAK